MESDNTTGTESDTSDWDLANAGLTSEYSEDSDEYGIYYGEENMYDTAIGGRQQPPFYPKFIGNTQTDRQASLQMRRILNQMNVSAADSGYGGSNVLYPIHETGFTTTDNDSFDDNSDETLSNHSSPVHTRNPVYGRYQKFPSEDDENCSINSSAGSLDHLMLHRLPGENLGMILGIEGGKDGKGTVTSVAVKSVTLGGAAYRATGSSKGVCVGDDIVTVNSLYLHTLSHDECIQVFKDMPLRVILGIRRGQKDLPAYSVSPSPMQDRIEAPHQLVKSSKFANSVKVNQPVEITRRREASDSEDDGFSGFAVYQVVVEKDPSENLGISIVPSYGSTKEYYQIKRILPSGAAAHSGNLQVGDRLITCNGTSLQALTQNRCLNIIKAASSRGDIHFEVIRPVYTGSSMEISVTVNNGIHSKHSAFDPSQYSLKAQSYDRNVDVVVTSESEDYLTVSEDEYSRNGRLANIPESEANQVFVSNSVRLAYQTPINSIEEESSEPETEEPSNNSLLLEREDVEIVDLNKFDTSPYHIPHLDQNRDKKSTENDLKLDLLQYKIEPKTVQETRSSPKLPLIHKIPQSELDNISISSLSPRSPRSDSDKYSPRSPVRKSNLEQLSPRSPVPRIDLDQISPRSPVPRSDLDQISPRSPVPRSNLDQISPRSPLPYTKRQQIPSDGETLELELPYNYPQDSLGEHIIVSDSEKTRYNPLYDDSNLSEFTDSETLDLYIASSNTRDIIPSSDLDKISIGSNRTHIRVDTEAVSVGSDNEDIALPPPVEFSDYRNNDENIEDQAENNLDSFDEDANLAFNSELTAPFDIVLQEQGIDVRKGIDFETETAADDEILQVVTSYDNGTVLISQFEPNFSKSYNYPSEGGHFSQSVENNNNYNMDENSEAMLKDALDIEYENLPDNEKYEHRLNLGKNIENGLDEFEENFDGTHNVVAENIAVEIVQNEKGNYGYYVESDHEPDQFPEEDNPEDAPDLPDVPPPILNLDNNQDNCVTVTVMVNGKKDDGSEKILNRDENWSLHAKPVNKNSNQDEEVSVETNKDNAESDIIVPVIVQRKVEIAISDNSNEIHEGEIIVPASANREFQLPPTFTDKIPSPETEQKDFDPDVTVTTHKVPPPVKPKPRKTKPVGENNELVEEEPIVPIEVKKDNTKHLVNVINVVHAFKAGAKDKDPDVVDKIEKEEIREKARDVFSSIIKVNEKKSDNDLAPPVAEQINTDREQIVVKKKISAEMSPPKHDTLEENKVTITKPTVRKKPEEEKGMDQPSDVEITVKMTSISVEKPKAEVKTELVVNEKKEKNDVSKLVPPLDLDFVSGSGADSLSPKSDKSGGSSPTEMYKTTINVPKQPAMPPVTVAKQLGQLGHVAKQPETKVPVSEPETILADKVKSEETMNKKPDSAVTVAKQPEHLGHVAKQPETNVPDFEPSEPETVPSENEKSKETSRPSLVPTPHIKPLSQIKPLSFNPKSLSQSSSKPVQYKTTISTLGVKPGLSAFSKLSSQKAPEHPIKRMETMPFEVSILKGILGIGIKTIMTPEGFVKVTEILPNGPVGREGNIKVGDYILSINSTQLTGLTDGKVQQILRLLPRGLSKIVASAVPPDQIDDSIQASAEKPQLAVPQSLPPSTSEEKTKLSPRQSLPIIAQREATSSNSQNDENTSPRQAPSPRQPNIITNPNAEIVLPRPVAAPRSPSHLKPSPTEGPPPVAPKPAKRPSAFPRLTTESSKTDLPSPASSASSTPSPVTSPRQQDQQQQSPRTPPAVAPKPKKTPTKKVEPLEDPNAPIEAELFVSINANSESSSNQKSRNILPGSVTYDVVEKESKTGWTAGIVSSADIKNQEKTGVIKGNIDVVSGTDTTKNDVVASTESQDSVKNSEHESSTELSHDLHIESPIDSVKADKVESTVDSVKADNVETPIDSVKADNVEPTVDSVKAENIDKQFEDMEKDLECPKVDVSLLSNRSRTFSTSSNSSSYNEFNECDVEDDNVPDQIMEEDEGYQAEVQSKDEDYESDFEEEHENSPRPETEVDMSRLKHLAETIVTDVISSIKASDFAAVDLQTEQNDSSDDDSPPLPSGAPPIPSSAPPTMNGSPPSEAPPPLPRSPPPFSESEVNESSNTVTVNDLALYPDSDHGSEETSDNKTEHVDSVPEEVIDVVDMSITSDLHASPPQFSNNIGDDDNHSVNEILSDADCLEYDYENDNSLSSQVTEDLKDQVDLKTDYNDTVDQEDEQSVSNVILMYSQLDESKEIQKLEEFNIESNNNEVKPRLLETGVETSEVINTVSSNIASETVTADAIKKEPLETDIETSKVINTGSCNTASENKTADTSNKDEKVEQPVEIKVNGYKEGSDRSVTTSDVGENMVTESEATSPSSETKYASRVDEILSQTEDFQRGKISADTDRMIRMFSSSEEPVNEGEGEIIEVTVNKGVTGLGFIIQGGKGSPKGDLPISIKRIFKGGPADGILQVRDEIYLVNGEDLSDMRHSEAWNHLKFLPSGDLVMKIRRYQVNDDA